MSIKLFNNLPILEKALDASWLNNKIISNNLSNVDTPNYRRQTVEFKDALSNALDKKNIEGYITHQRHIPIGRQEPIHIKAKIRQDAKDNIMRADGNSVDIDTEMTLQSKNSIYYDAVSIQLSNQLNKLKMTLREVGR